MLSKDWLIEGIQDFEYKKYVLLAFLHKSKMRFEHHALYPHLGQLVEHYNYLLSLQDQKQGIDAQTPRSIKGIDLKKRQIIYEDLPETGNNLEWIIELINYAIPEMQDALELGKDTYEKIERELNIEPIGVLPLYKNEGYYILNNHGKQTLVYRYQIKNIHLQETRFVAISSRMVKQEKLSFTNHYSKIKENLIKEFKDLPNPATYLVHSPRPYPIRYSLVPITERLLVRQIAA